VLEITDKEPEDEDDDFASKEHHILVELFQALWYVVLSHTDFICYAMVFLNQVRYTSMPQNYIFTLFFLIQDQIGEHFITSSSPNGVAVGNFNLSAALKNFLGYAHRLHTSRRAYKVRLSVRSVVLERFSYST
jgi:hypothetical protein